jgi:ribosomal subunit interface protein
MSRSGELVEITIHGRHAGISDRFKAFVNDKILGVTKFSMPIHRVDIELSHELNPRQHDRAYEVEITCSGSPFVRVEAHAADKYGAFEAAYDKLEERLRRLHERTKSVRHERLVPELIVNRVVPEDIEVEDHSIVLEAGPLLVRTKHIDTASMTVEEAVEAMELVGHDFFLFENVATGLPSVIYRRRGYDFGLIQLGELQTAARSA